jgi:hypothetical protein
MKDSFLNRFISFLLDYIHRIYIWVRKSKVTLLYFSVVIYNLDVNNQKPLGVIMEKLMLELAAQAAAYAAKVILHALDSTV